MFIKIKGTLKMKKFDKKEIKKIIAEKEKAIKSGKLIKK
jgi:hypothetical protein